MKFTKGTDIFIKADQLKYLLRKHVDQSLTPKQMLRILVHVKNYRLKFRTSINNDEKKANDLLYSIGVTPRTAYEWIYATMMPEDLKKKVNDGKVPMKRAQELYKNRMKKEKACLGLQILEEARKIIEGL